MRRRCRALSRSARCACRRTPTRARASSRSSCAKPPRAEKWCRGTGRPGPVVPLVRLRIEGLRGGARCLWTQCANIDILPPTAAAAAYRRRETDVEIGLPGEALRAPGRGTHGRRRRRRAGKLVAAREQEGRGCDDDHADEPRAIRRRDTPAVLGWPARGRAAPRRRPARSAGGWRRWRGLVGDLRLLRASRASRTPVRPSAPGSCRSAARRAPAPLRVGSARKTSCSPTTARPRPRHAWPAGRRGRDRRAARRRPRPRRRPSPRHARTGPRAPWPSRVRRRRRRPGRDRQRLVLGSGHGSWTCAQSLAMSLSFGYATSPVSIS